MKTSLVLLLLLVSIVSKSQGWTSQWADPYGKLSWTFNGGTGWNALRFEASKFKIAINPTVDQWLQGTGTPIDIFEVNKDAVLLSRPLVLSDNFLCLRATGDYSHSIGYNSSIDGLEMRGYKGFVWKTVSGSAAERMRLNEFGNLGIGTTTPEYKLVVNGRMKVNKGIYGSAGIWFGNSSNTDTYFVGAESDTHCGFYSAQLIGTNQWGFLMNGLTGNVSIGGGKNPVNKLEVAGTIVAKVAATSTSPVSTAKFLNSHNTIGDQWFVGFGIGADGSDNNDRVRLITKTTSTGAIFSIASGGNAATMFEKFRIDEIGRVGIGTGSPTEMLHVLGNVKASAFITDASKFPDYVFAPDYKLKSLDDVKQYIDAHKKLPGMPSEKDVLANGLNLKEVSVSSVEKIEEIYLYILQLNDRIKDLEAKLAEEKN